MERKDICDAMIFALDNADSAFEVSALSVRTHSQAMCMPYKAVILAFQRQL